MARSQLPLWQPTVLDGYGGPTLQLRSAQRLGCLAAILQKAGTSSFTLNGQSRRLRPGQVLILDPEQNLINKRFSRRSMVVGIEFDLLPRQLRPEDKDYPNNAWHPQAKQPRQPTWSQIVGRALPSILPEAGSNYCAPLITEAVRTWWLHPLGRLQAIQRITQIALHLLATYGQDQPIHPADPLAKAEAAARAAIPKGFSVGDMAAAAHMPRSSLSACYRRSRGESPSIFLRRLRVDAVARFALRNNDYERMARNLGWPTKRLMAQYISRATGKSWRQWLATVKE